MEKFFLNTFLASDKLNVIKEKYINITVFFSEFIHSVHMERFYHFIGKVLAVYITDFLFSVILLNFIAYSAQKMSFLPGP